MQLNFIIIIRGIRLNKESLLKKLRFISTDCLIPANDLDEVRDSIEDLIDEIETEGLD